VVRRLQWIIGVVAAATLAATVAPQTTLQRPEPTAAKATEHRVARLIARMRREEKLALVLGYLGTSFPEKNYVAPAAARPGSAGYVPGVPRLGIPPQWLTDAGIGVATQVVAPVKYRRTALPSMLALASSWDPSVARAAGAMIGDEARRTGFNVMLAGGVNLLRDPRGGRSFEYAGEDPLLAGTIAGAQIAGVQSNRIISTVKHFAVNDQETGRGAGNAVIDEAAARMSDLLAFQIAIERGHPGAVMCALNRVNGMHACESEWLLTDVLRRDWGFAGYVMSDWGATHSAVRAAKAGLDQESGWIFDDRPWYGTPLREALAKGTLPAATLDRMVGHILTAMIETGVMDAPMPRPTPIDFARHADVARRAAERGAVLLRNQGGLLPLSRAIRSIAVIGGHADRGVMAGGGSSLVYPRGGNAVPGLMPTGWPGPVMFYPSAPLAAIRREAPNARVFFVDGTSPAAAAAAARRADVAIVFVTQWSAESRDVSIALDAEQDAVVVAAATANPRTVVVAETGGPVLMPWSDRVGAILEAWYPGTMGGEAIARLLFGRVAPSGRLPASFPADASQLARPAPIDPHGLRGGDPSDIPYSEGANVGYRWYQATGRQPRFSFGHGLAYTSFRLHGLTVTTGGPTVTARFSVTNLGSRRGVAVPQIYARAAWSKGRQTSRLAGWARIALDPGKTRTVTVALEPRALRLYDVPSHRWKPVDGPVDILLASSVTDAAETQRLAGQVLTP
jgi:beta-glucosidase